jgi:DNA-binding response OmpR family regulator
MVTFHPLGAQGRVLIVEDDDGSRELFADALRFTGYYVRTAADGLEGIRMLETFEPDVVVLDLGLPIATGFEILHELRSRASARKTPAIAISGLDRGVELAQGNPDFFTTLKKPFQPDALVRAVSRAMDIRKSVREEI